MKKLLFLTSSGLLLANKLSDDPNNKNLARKAKSDAKDAKKDSRNARSESGSLDKLNKDIQELEKKIFNNQEKLNKLTKDNPTKPTTTDTLRTQL